MIAIPLDALGTGQGRRINRPPWRQRAPQTWHFRTHRRQKCCRGVLEQVPTVDHDAPVAVAAAPGEVVDANHPRRWRRHGGRVAASQNPKHGVARPRRRQTRHHARTPPPSATAAARTSASQRLTLRLYRRPTGGANSSLNVRLGQGVCVQRNGRTDSRSLTVLPLTGRSDSVRSYRLWRDIDGIAQSGQFAPTAAKRPDISTIPSITVRLSTIKPGNRRLLSHAFEAIDVRSLLIPQWSWPDTVRKCQIRTEFESYPRLTSIDILAEIHRPGR